MSEAEPTAGQTKGEGRASRTRVVDVRRLAAAAVLLAAVFGGLAYLEGRQGAGDGEVVVEAAHLLETKQDEDGRLDVSPEKGALAPDFEATRIDGGRLRLSDFRGSPVLIKFWATWCAACLAEFPHIKELHQRYESAGLRVVALNAGQSRLQAKDFTDFLDAPFDWALDPGLVVSDAYKVIGFPVSVFIDRDGVIRATYIGEMDPELMDSFTRAAVDAVPAPEAPFKLRLITNLPRENVVLVQEGRGAGRLLFASRSFRCDTGYCRDDIPTDLKASAAVRDATFDRRSEPPVLTVFFDPGVMSEEQVIDAVKHALIAEPDPLYEGLLEVRRVPQAEEEQ